jgi:hypothetical protein
MIDLQQELSVAGSDADPAPGAVDRARAAARRRRTRRRAVVSIAAVLVVLGLVAGAWAVVTTRANSRESSVLTGPGVGADAPTALTVVCTAQGPVLNSDIVQVGPAGLPVEWRNDTDAPANIFIGSAERSSGGTGGLVPPRSREDHVLEIPPGRTAVTCGADRTSDQPVEVTIVDPQGLYSSIELDCGSGGQAVVDMSGDGPAVASAEDALGAVLSDDALADHDVQPAGYPLSDPRPYVVRRHGKIVARPGFRTTPDGLVLVELYVCSDAMPHH